MNLVEMMIVVALLSLIGIAAACACQGLVAQSRAKRARLDVATIAVAAEVFVVRNAGTCPATVSELVDAELLAWTGQRTDPWGGQLVIECRADGEVSVLSRGRDGAPATADDIRSDRPSEGPVNPGQGFLLAGMALIAIPFMAVVLLFALAFLAWVSSNPGHEASVKEALDVAVGLIGVERLEGWRLWGEYRWWKTRVVLLPKRFGAELAERRPGAEPPRIDVRGAEVSLTLVGSVVIAQRRGFHSDPEALASMISMARALVEAREVLRQESALTATIGPYR